MYSCPQSRLFPKEDAMEEQKPVGAVAIVAILTVVILVAWFGVYALSVARG